MKNIKAIQKLKDFIFTDSSIQKIEREDELLKMKIENYCDDLFTIIFNEVIDYYDNEPLYIIDIKLTELELNFLIEFYDDEGVCCRLKFADVNIIENVGNGQFLRDASDRLNFELPNIEASRYKEICKKIISTFEAKELGDVVNGFDEVYQDISIKGNLISIEWDNWSGLIVIAKDKKAEGIVREIGKFISTEE